MTHNRFYLTLLIVLVFAGFTQVLQTQQVAAQSFNYTFLGPIFDAGTQQSGTAVLTLTSITGDSQQVSVSTGSSYTYTGVRLLACSWNASSTLNITRVIEFLPSDGTANGNQMFQIYMANPDNIMAVYMFSVLDYTGQASFAEVKLGNNVVERRSLALSGAADFALYKGITYTINVIGQTGVFSQLFTAGNIYNNDIILLAGSFGEVDFSSNRTIFTATRTPENDVINLKYFTNYTTGTFNFNIYKRDGASLYNVYNNTINNSGEQFVFIWSDIEKTVNYVVQGVTYDAAGQTLFSWNIDLPVRTDKTNPWAVLLDPFVHQISTLPNSSLLPEDFNILQLPATVIICLVLAIISWRNSAAGMLLAWVIAAIMVGIGWFVVSFPAFGFALFLTVLIAVSEAKRTEREL